MDEKLVIPFSGNTFVLTSCGLVSLLSNDLFWHNICTIIAISTSCLKKLYLSAYSKQDYFTIFASRFFYRFS